MSRVSVDKEAWDALEQLLLDTPARRALPIVDLIRKTGSGAPIEESQDDD